MTLTGGALASNIFWQVANYVSAGACAHLEGVLLTANTLVAFETGATLNGRILAQTATLDQATIMQPPTI
jgi:hypothetical protein